MNNSKAILIVDDAMDNCRILKDIFEDKGFSVDIAGNKMDASKLLEKNFYKIALIDLFLEPSDGGIEVLKRIKEKWPVTKLYAMTASHKGKELEEASYSGVSKIFIKPFDVEEMVQTFEQVE